MKHIKLKDLVLESQIEKKKSIAILSKTLLAKIKATIKEEFRS